jgi:hypothetical protein
MPTHHPESEIYDFITGDFRSCWDALAAKTAAEGPTAATSFSPCRR